MSDLFTNFSGGGRKKKVKKVNTVFIYGGNHFDKLKTIIDNDEIVSYKAYIENYIRIFCGHDAYYQSSVASLTPMNGNKVRGYVTMINDIEFDLLKEHESLKNFTLTQLKAHYFTKNNKGDINIVDEKAHVFIYNDHEWNGHPSMDYVNECVQTLYMHWFDLDSNREYYIRDKFSKLKAIYHAEGNRYEEIDQTENIDVDNQNNLTAPIKLKNSPFYAKILEKDPDIILKESQGEFNAYSKSCQWNIRKQPVILTEEEKKEIDRKNPGSYDGAIKYGSDPKNQYYYICPRFWNFKTNQPMREEDVDPKHLIKPGTEHVSNPKEKYIFEFLDHKGKYTKRYPGFVPGNKHPKGFCAPCCYNNLYTPTHVKTRKQCNAEFDNEKKNQNSLTSSKSENEEEKTENIRNQHSAEKNIERDYILGPDKFPLTNNRAGHLTPTLEGFLDFNSFNCMISVKSKKFKEQHPCILRQGVEFNKKSSFVSCIASVYNEINKKNLSNIEMRNHLATLVNLDNILEIHNGNIVKIFDNKNYEKTDIEKYSSTKLYSTLYESARALLYKCVNALENFIEYLMDESLVLNHKYLWDIVCKPNDDLFKEGLNVVILDETNYDLTNNIDILCPPNSYSKYYFDVNKPSIICYKRNEFFELLINFEKTKSKIHMSRLFYLSDVKLPSLKNILLRINEIQKHQCMPKEKQPNEQYPFKHNIHASIIMSIIDEIGSKVIKQQLITT